MNTRFYIMLTLKTHKGLETFANFFIGNNRERAYDIFRQLKGTDKVNEKNVLYIDFMETSGGLPVNINMISCTLDQLAENCKLITKELFKLANFDFSG
jgi:hypothetical protein